MSHDGTVAIPQPAGVVGAGYGTIENAFNYGVYGVTRQYQPGLSKNEFDAQNYTNDDANFAIPYMSTAIIAGTNALPEVIGVSSAARGYNANTIGYALGSDATDSSFFYTGLYMAPGVARNYGIYEAAGQDGLFDLQGPRWSAWLNNPMTPQPLNDPSYSAVLIAPVSSGSTTIAFTSPLAGTATASTTTAGATIPVSSVGGLQVAMHVEDVSRTPNSNLGTIVDIHVASPTSITVSNPGSVMMGDTLSITPVPAGPPGVALGMTVTSVGTTIPPGTFVTNVNEGTITLNKAITGSNAAARLAFGPPYSISATGSGTPSHVIPLASTYGIEVGMTAVNGSSTATVQAVTESTVTVSASLGVAPGNTLEFSGGSGGTVSPGHNEFVGLTLQGQSTVQPDGTADNANMAMFQILDPNSTQRMYVTYEGDVVIPNSLQLGVNGNIEPLSASQAIVLGAPPNTASGPNAIVTGGLGNTASGADSRVGGAGASDNGRINADCWSSGKHTIAGDQQTCSFVLHGIGVGNQTLTADGSGTLSPSNCVNAPGTASALGVSISVTGIDEGTLANSVSWTPLTGVFNNSTTGLVYNGDTHSPTPHFTGTLAGSPLVTIGPSSPSLKCLDIVVTPGSADTAAWHWVARVDTVEVE